MVQMLAYNLFLKTRSFFPTFLEKQTITTKKENRKTQTKPP